MSRALAYIRVSKEKEDGVSPEIQLAAIEKHCASLGHTIVEVIQDLDLSGRFWKRRQVERAIGMIERREADVLVVWKISRVSRNRRDWNIAVDRVESIGGHLESATEAFAANSTGRFARGVMAELAAFESERIGESWKEAQERRIRHGLPHTGGPRFGYTYTPKQGYSIHPEAGEALRGMYLDYIGGAGFSKLTPASRAHGGPQEAAGVKRMMDSGFAAGLILYRGQTFPGAHEPLIDELTWERYQKARRKRSNRPRAEVPRHPFSGIVKCACGSYMGGNRYTQRGVTKTKYQCQAYRYGKDHTNSITEPLVEAAVLEFLKEVAEEINARAHEHLEAAKTRVRRIDPRPKLKADLAKVLGRIDSLNEKWLDGEIDTDSRDRLLSKYKSDRKALEERLEHLDAQQVGPPPRKLAADLLAAWEVIPPEVKREMLSKLLDRVVVPRGVGTRWNPKKPVLVPVWEAS
jgi:DNA invertase Pin-like site-specific DNA recombinase